MDDDALDRTFDPIDASAIEHTLGLRSSTVHFEFI